MKKQTVNVYTCPNCRREMKNDKLGSLNDYMVVCESCGWRGWTKNVIVTTKEVEPPADMGEQLVTMYDGWKSKSERGTKHVNTETTEHGTETAEENSK